MTANLWIQINQFYAILNNRSSKIFLFIEFFVIQSVTTTIVMILK